MGTVLLASPDVTVIDVGAQRAPDTEERRKTLRCSHCQLMQFATLAGKCRKCRTPYEAEPAQVVELPVAQALKAKYGERIKYGAPAQYDYSAAVKLLRFAKGWSQKELAGHIGIPRTYVSKVENLRTDMNVKTMMRFAAALDVTMAELITIAEIAAQYVPR